MVRVIVTGCAGFIGSTLVDRLLAADYEVVGIDDFSTGQRRFLDSASGHPNFRLIEGTLADRPKLVEWFSGAQFVFHLAANADVRFGTDHPAKDLEQNTIVTFNILEAMRANGIRRIAFSSTGSVYGEAKVFPTPEDGPFPVQTSLYGASKLAGEGLISAYCEGFDFQAYIFRFVSILGERYSHGHVFDFAKQLRKNPHELHVLGDGKQRKSYLYVQDCIDAILTAIDTATDKVNLFNLGAPDYCELNQSIGWICEALNVKPRLVYGGGARGWIGDNPMIFLDTARIRALGWKPALSIEQGVKRTVAYLQQNAWLLDLRD
ncbi:NAD-dependent epimerase/dehydratase family protein [soil metagenome]